MNSTKFDFDAIAELLDANSAIANQLPHFERRPQQLAMAAHVADAFHEGHHLAIEAGTGVGKTLAYLVPAVELATRTNSRVVVSTHTIALQEQLIAKDIPLVLSAFDTDIRAELVKGRRNYLGLRRLRIASERQRGSECDDASLRTLHTIEDWAYETNDGSLSDLPVMPNMEMWERVRSESNNCQGRRCPTFAECFYQRARRRAEAAKVLVVNHALFVSDLVLRQHDRNVIPDYDYVIIDEAHNFASVATDHFGVSVSNVQIQHLLSQLFNDRTGRGFLASVGDERQRDAVIAAAGTCTTFFNDVWGWQSSRGRENGRVVAPLPFDNALSEALHGVAERLRPLADDLPNDDDKTESRSYVERLTDAAEQLRLIHEQDLSEHVYWIDTESRDKSRITLHAAPLNIGPQLQRLLFDRVNNVVLTSATLATAGKEPFAHLLDSLGWPDAKTVQLDSPFNYEEQVTVHVEAGMPEPSNYEAFADAAARAIAHYARKTEGRAFALFTSYRMLGNVATQVRNELEIEGYTILQQGQDGSRSQLLQEFRDTPRAVLFGTDSFWQGVDVAGDALQNVIITRLPFTFPDRPLYEARLDHIRQSGGNPFFDYQVPDAILRLRQGFGRLVRSQRDKGIVVLLDPRVVTKRYGRQFLDSLPKCNLETHDRRW